MTDEEQQPVMIEHIDNGFIITKIIGNRVLKRYCEDVQKAIICAEEMLLKKD